MAKKLAPVELRPASSVTLPIARKDFADYQPDAATWITLATGEFYPDILPEACELYKPVLVLFGQLLRRSESSIALFQNICELTETWMRVQLARVFRKYVSPTTPVEMLKGKSKVKSICDQFGPGFRPIQEVQKAFESRPIPDEALCAVLWEYKDRGKKGYDLTEKFFTLIRAQLPAFTIVGPERAGQDVLLGVIFLNDGPGLLLGSMWSDYSSLERSGKGRIRVVTLRMVPERVTAQWLES